MTSRAAARFIVVMEIRRATPEDVPDVTPMVRKLCELHRSWDRAKYDFVEGIEEMYREFPVPVKYELVKFIQ